MAKKKRRRPRKSQKSKLLHRLSPGKMELDPELMSLISGIGEEELIETYIKAGLESQDQFDTNLTDLEYHLLKKEPIQLLSVLSFYGLSTMSGRHPEDNPLKPFHVELLQALILKNQYSSYKAIPFLPNDFEVFRKLIERSSQGFYLRRMNSLKTAQTKQERLKLSAIEEIRLQTQVIRNWAYPDQMIKIAKDILSPIDSNIEKTIGVKLCHIIDMFTNLITIAQTRMNNHLEKLSPLLKTKSVSEAIQRYYQIFPHLKSSSQDLLNSIKKRKMKLKDLKFALLSHSDLNISKIYTFTLENFSSAYPGDIDDEILFSILKQLSLSFGDLATHNTEHFFLGNPIWTRPLIHIEENTYFWPILNLFYAFIFEIMENLIHQYPNLVKQYENSRSAFLEKEIEKQFNLAFPKAKIYRGSQWTDPKTKKTYENDLLVLIDSYLFIIEAKSAKIAESARRGAELRFQKTINELIVEPSVQAKRFGDFLGKKPGIHNFTTKTNKINHVDTSNVYKIVKFNISLELFELHGMTWPQLRQAGLIPEDITPTPTISIGDLEVIFDILEGDCSKIHYLIRRSEFEENTNYVGDEIDLLSFYLETGFNVGETEYDGTVFMLMGSSQMLDPYLMPRWGGEGIEKPKPALTNWWNDIINQIEKRGFSRWTELGYILLNTSHDDQIKFEKKLKEVIRIVNKEWQTPGHINTVHLYNGPTQRRDSIVGLAYKRINKKTRNEFMQNSAGTAIEESFSDRALVIGIDLDREDYPYSVIACLEEPLKE